MKVEVIYPFRDIDDFSVAYHVGDIIDVADERAAKLVALKLAEKVKEEAEPEKAPSFTMTGEETKRNKRNKE